MAIPALEAGAALFLDFDGTLVDLAHHPEAVAVRPGVRRALARLAPALGGALAIVTGREIARIDAFLAPLVLPVAGVHGLARRDAAGRVHAAAVPRGALDGIEAALAPLLARGPELVLERKAAGLALHYRACPELGPACRAAMQAALEAAPGIELKEGKMVLEAKPAGADKGTAVEAFLAEPPFAGRRPVFAGDDVTDEDAFRVVNARGGVTIKVGAGASVAAHGLPDPAALARWLAAGAQRIGAEGTHGGH